MSYLVVYGNIVNHAKTFTNDGDKPIVFEWARPADKLRKELRNQGFEALYCENAPEKIEAAKAEINRRTGYQAPAKPACYGRLAVYWHSGEAQKTEEFNSPSDANRRYAELLPAKKAGQLAILEPRYLVVDVAFEDGDVYTYFVHKKHRKGAKLSVVARNGMKEVKAVRGAYWATRKELAAKCDFGRYKVAYAPSELKLPMA